MNTPLLHRQLHDQLRQWLNPKDQRHLKVFAENVAAILQAQQGCLSKWLPFLSHRRCKARSHMERLSYFVHNQHISAERFYIPLIRQVLSSFRGQEITLTLDTSMLWEDFCLIEVCFVWGGRSLTLAQVVLEHRSATVSFEQYCPVLAEAKSALPDDCQVILLADRGFEHGALMRWLRHQQWSWAIRAKCDLNITLTPTQICPVGELFPPPKHAYLFPNITILDDIECHLATAHLPQAAEPWAVLSDMPCSLQTFEIYGRRFGGIEPHFKDYKSAAFEVLDSRLRNAQALTCLFMLIDSAYLIAVVLGVLLVQGGQRSRLDWHAQRGLSFLQLGLRELKSLGYRHLPLPRLQALPLCYPSKAYASKRKRRQLACSIEFSRVTTFSP